MADNGSNRIRSARWLFAALSILPILAFATPAVADEGLNIDSELLRPGVRLLAVEFYSTHCKPCMEAVPRWEALHKKYKDRGLRLIVVAVMDDQRCVNPGWHPDRVLCDDEGQLSGAMGVNGLPAAFLWSWTGELLVAGEGVEQVARAIDRELATLPRIALHLDKAGSDAATVARVGPLVRGELLRTGKVELVASEEEQQLLERVRKQSLQAGYSESTQCKLGEELAANSVLTASVQGGANGSRLYLQLLSAEKGCVTQVGVASWQPAKVELSVAAAVADLVQRLHSTAKMPGSQRAAGPRKPFGGTVFEQGKNLDTQEMQETIVKFNSTPPGSVMLGEKMLCKQVPCSKSVPLGRHSVSMVAEDYLVRTEVVTFTENTADISWTLKPDFATLAVECGAEPLALKVDGKPSGTCPVTDLRLNPGKHRVALDSPCHLGAEESFEVQQGQSKRVTLPVAARLGVVTIRARNTAGDDLRGTASLDGVALGNVPGSFKVPICGKDLTVFSPDHAGWHQTLQLKDGEKREVMAELRADRPSSPSPLLPRSPVPAGGEANDSWKGVTFSVANFDEVLDYVKKYHFDPKSESRSWVEAANFTLLRLNSSMEIVPRRFLDQRKRLADEAGRMDGSTRPFRCGDAEVPGVVLHQVPDAAYLASRKSKPSAQRLSNEEVQAARAKLNLRQSQYDEAWRAIPFGRREFECAMAQARVELSSQSGSASATGSEGTPPADENRLWIAAASGYLNALDPHSSVIPRAEWDKSTQQTQDNSFEGIGAVLTQRGDQTLVENPMDGRPAWRAGLRAGDVIHAIDGASITGMKLADVVARVRGKRDTTVVLTVSRESEPTPRNYSIRREKVEVKNVTGRLLDGYEGIGYVKMNGFIPQSTSDLKDEIQRLERLAPDARLRGLVLDLRGNSGGLLNKAIEVADLFLSRGRILSVKSRTKSEEVHDATASSSDYRMPLVVLVNDSSASASEIVASALQENSRGLVVGLRTYGKASVQSLFEPLRQDYYIKLTIARYYAPSGTTLQVVGVTPDVVVAPELDGTIPVGFREENLTGHMSGLSGPSRSPWLDKVPELTQCVATTGRAVTIARRDKNAQIKPDFQLLSAADYLNCLR